jgi:hypothetical protein
MVPANVIRVAEFRRQEMLTEAARERQATRAERARRLAPNSSRGWSFTAIATLIVASLASAGSVTWGRQGRHYPVAGVS